MGQPENIHREFTLLRRSVGMGMALTGLFLLLPGILVSPMQTAQEPGLIQPIPSAPSSQMTGTPTKLTSFLTDDSSDVSCTFSFSHRWEEAPDSGLLFQRKSFATLIFPGFSSQRILEQEGTLEMTCFPPSFY